MDYFLQYFGKPFESIIVGDIITYFKDQRQESNRTEFKSYSKGGNFDKNIKPIISTICAFLNSEGGFIIWGAPQGKSIPNKKEKIFSGLPTFVNVNVEHDKLINIVSDSITPMPSGISARVIGENTQLIYLFNIQASMIKPHQYDNKYMIRLDGQSRVAPHYYIEAMFKQIKYPDLEGFIKFGDVQEIGTVVLLDFETIIFNWSPFQNEKNIIILIFSPVGIFSHYNPRSPIINKYQEYGMNGHTSLIRKLDDILFNGSPFQDDHRLTFELQDVAKEKDVELLLRFGGENSPQKESYYKFIIRVDKDNKPFVVITERSENRMISDIRSEIGINKNDIIKQIIGR